MRDNMGQEQEVDPSMKDIHLYSTWEGGANLQEKNGMALMWLRESFSQKRTGGKI